MNTLKPCPFCGGAKICTEKSINLNYCDNCSAESNIEHWNTRPIEDDLRKRIAELEVEVTKGHELQDSYCDRIAELEEANKYWSKRDLIGERWIPVSERLPEDLQSVAIITNDSMTGIVRYLELYGREGFGAWSEDVTHWMPLPEPPEVNNE